MNSPTRFLIHKDTDVWVAKGVGFPCMLTKHKMLKDMSIPYPVSAIIAGPKVVGLAHECSDLNPSQIMMLKALSVKSALFEKRSDAPLSFYSLLNWGWHIFATDDEEYPFLVVHHTNVDEIDNEWDTEDSGDGLKVHRLKQHFRVKEQFRTSFEEYINDSI